MLRMTGSVKGILRYAQNDRGKRGFFATLRMTGADARGDGWEKRELIFAGFGIEVHYL